MKNLLITLGILILMTMGMVYDQDLLYLAQQQRNLKWIAHEMADAAAAHLSQSELEEVQAWDAAERAVEDILRKNTSEDTVWYMEKRGNTVVVKVSRGPAAMCLPFPDKSISLSYCAEEKI